MKSLTADEICGLHRAMGTGGTTAKSVRPYDLARPRKLPKSKALSLEEALSKAARSWEESLSAVCGCDASLEIGTPERATFGECVESACIPGAACLLDADGLNGAACIETPADLALRIVNRMAGGRAETRFEARQLTQVELSILGRFLSRFCEGLSEAWGGAIFRVADCRLQISGCRVRGGIPIRLWRASVSRAGLVTSIRRSGSFFARRCLTGCRTSRSDPEAPRTGRMVRSRRCWDQCRSS